MHNSEFYSSLVLKNITILRVSLRFSAASNLMFVRWRKQGLWRLIEGKEHIILCGVGALRNGNTEQVLTLLTYIEEVVVSKHGQDTG
jgi:hypothetical protein